MNAIVRVGRCVMNEPTTIRGATARLLRGGGRFTVRYVRGVLILILMSVARVSLDLARCLERDSGRLNRKQGIPAGGDF
jgi:hypothetical protein